MAQTASARARERRVIGAAITLASGLFLGSALFGGALAAADPAEPDETPIAQPGPPMPVPSSAFGYLATRSATVSMAQHQPHRVIADLPVPEQYRQANQAMADHLERELEAAVATPGACIQIIIDPDAGGDLFDYGIWSVEPEYCPT